MSKIVSFLFLVLLASACTEHVIENNSPSRKWTERTVEPILLDSLERGSIYLPVHSRVYNLSEQHPHILTITVSVRNLNQNDTIFLSKASYYDVEGNSIGEYLDHSVFVKPNETVEILIDKINPEGKKGSNFIFGWSAPKGKKAPLIQAVMISTTGHEGISYATEGIEL